MTHTVNPVWVTGHYRFENDDGSLTTSTFIAAEDTTITQNVDVNFRLRINWGENAGQTTATSFTPKLEFRINAGSWTVVTASSACFAVASSNEADDASSTTERLTTAPTNATTYVDSRFEESDGILPADTPVDAYHEAVFNLQLNSTSISDTDTIDFRLVDSSGTETITTIDTTPSLTVGSPIPPNWISGHFRFENDDGTVSASTFIDAEDTDVSIDLDTNFRIRMNWGEADGQETATLFKPKLEYSLNSGAWTVPTTSTACKIVDSTHEVDESTTVDERLTTAPTGCTTYVDTRFADVNAPLPGDTPVDAYHEAVWNLSMDSASVSNGDTIDFRIVDNDGTESFDTTQTTPRVTAGSSVTGSAAITEGDDSSVASGTSLITGTAAITEGDDTSTASGMSIEPVDGSAAITEGDDTSTASGTSLITGSAAITEGDDTSTASGTSLITGSAAITEGDDSSVASGMSIEPVDGSAAITEGDDSSVASGTSLITGTAAITEGDDTSTASGTSLITGTAAITEADDTSTASGTSLITGTAAITEADDTSIASGTSLITGTAAITEVDDISTASGEEEFTGSAAITEADDTSIASGSTTDGVSGTAAITEVDDISTASGEEEFTGSAAITEVDDTNLGSGTAGVDNVTGETPPLGITQIGNSFTETSTYARLSQLSSNNIVKAERSGSDSIGKYFWNGTDFDLVGNLLYTTIDLREVTGLSDTRCVVIDNDYGLQTYDFDGSNWSTLGNALALGAISFPHLCSMTSSRIAQYDDTNSEIRAYNFDGTDWTLTGTGFSLTVINSMSRISDTDIVVLRNDKLRRYTFNGSTWSIVGSESAVMYLSAPQFPDITMLDDGITVVLSDRTGAIVIAEWDGSTFIKKNDETISGVTNANDICNLNTEEFAWTDDSNDELRAYRVSAGLAESEDSVSASGTSLITGTVTITEEDDNSVASGEFVIRSIGSDPNIEWGDNTNTTWGDNTNTEWSGTLDGITEGNDNSVAGGNITDEAIIGLASVIELGDNTLASGEFKVISITQPSSVNIEWGDNTNTTWGNLINTEWSAAQDSTTEGDDTSTSSGSVITPVSGSVVLTEPEDNTIGSGLIIEDITASSTITELGDINISVGQIRYVNFGLANATEDNDANVALGKRKGLNKMYIGSDLVTSAYKGSEPINSIYLGDSLLTD